MLDPQVQIRVIDLAWKWTEANVERGIEDPEARLKQASELFDKAYKAILETVQAEQGSRPKTAKPYI